MPHRHLPTQPLHPNAVPDIADRSTWQRSRNELLSREKAHTREGDAIAAARRHLPMTQVPDDATAGGPNGPIPFAHIFEGRRMLLAYFHMWHDGEPWERQCEGCTFTASHLLRLEYLHERDVTAVVLSQGTYGESKPYADFLGYPAPWYSARDSETLLAGTTDRGTEAADTSYHLLDLTVFGRQERWEDSPQDWPRQPEGQHQWRALGRPTAQWSVTDEPVAP